MTLEEAVKCSHAILGAANQRLADQKVLLCLDVRVEQPFVPEVYEFFIGMLKRDNAFLERAAWLINKGTTGLAIYNVARSGGTGEAGLRVVSATPGELLHHMAGIATYNEMRVMQTFFGTVAAPGL